MNKETGSAGFTSRLWKLFASVRLTVVILLSLAVTSIIGTIIPQNERPEAYLNEYGEFLYKILSAFDVFDMYHSWWFQFLLLMLTTNIVVCSINRFSALWKMLSVKNPSFNVSKFRNLSDKEEFIDIRSPEDLKRIYMPIVSRSFGYKRIEETDNGFCIFAEKGRWTRIGVYVIHLSVILLLIGGLIGSIFGFKGFVNIPEGKTINSIRLSNTGKAQDLNFDIRCDNFNIKFYDSGAPSEYRSTLTILEQGKSVLTRDIIVNDPLRYKGINIFQSSYGELPPREITLNFKNRITGMSHKKKVSFGQQFNLPEDAGQFVVKGYRDSYNFGGHNLGKTFMGILTHNNGSPVHVIMPVRFPVFDRMRKGNQVVSVVDYDHRYYTGLQVTRDPGVLIVYSGFVIMIIGCFITFFMSHQRLCVEISKSGKKSKVMVAGTANKNRFGMQSRIKRIAKSLRINL
ncbi:MAG: cytochrome c biogenesis protein ResB [Desulfobacterales bacterium]|uniref:Cytochrome c biogenesis protein ResB n=1 Tax=Candidatus Desulfaltia bathyphila TaxID=2841697 RepID=A0A8J6N2W0_9BACT|nr:cytochrome c biogenesis protein ResB [Candidatus Desulfaltia bathyphila]MBL7195831.1 cytochrome c biogenesis protein ResB [Desulfobacterales bacterium]MBL7207867.1 cytochrome c biogenesis protein ResB [Desulfobacterales bacterium]